MADKQQEKPIDWDEPQEPRRVQLWVSYCGGGGDRQATTADLRSACEAAGLRLHPTTEYRRLIAAVNDVLKARSRPLPAGVMYELRKRVAEAEGDFDRWIGLDPVHGIPTNCGLACDALRSLKERFGALADRLYRAEREVLNQQRARKT